MLDRAIDLAKLSEYPQHKVGCVIIDKKGRIISTGVNMRKTHPTQARFARRVVRDDHAHRCFLHAEIAALVKVRKQPHTMYVARWRRNQTVGMARPCPICFQAIIESGCKRVVYTNTDGTFSILDLE